MAAVGLDAVVRLSLSDRAAPAGSGRHLVAEALEGEYLALEGLLALRPALRHLRALGAVLQPELNLVGARALRVRRGARRAALRGRRRADAAGLALA